MPNYNPNDMALILRMQKSAGAALTPEELKLMQGINQAMQPEIAAGNVGMMTGAAMSPAEAAMMQNRQAGTMSVPTGVYPRPIRDPNSIEAMPPVPLPQGRQVRSPDDALYNMNPAPMPTDKTNRLAAIQAAANQILAGEQGDEQGRRMANIARYFQGRK